jgi:hypothetical protein
LAALWQQRTTRVEIHLENELASEQDAFTGVWTETRNLKDMLIRRPLGELPIEEADY